MDAQHRPQPAPLLFAAFLIIIGFLFTVRVTDANHLSEIISIVQAPLALAVGIAYLPEAWAAMTARRPTGTQFLILGIVLAWFSFAGMRLWSLLFRLSDRPDWMLNVDLVNGLAIMMTCSAILHIVAPGALHGAPRRSAVNLAGAIAIGVLGLLLYMFFHPDVGSLMERTRPYLEHKAQVLQSEAAPVVYANSYRSLDGQLCEHGTEMDCHYGGGFRRHEIIPPSGNLGVSNPSPAFHYTDSFGQLHIFVNPCELTCVVPHL